MSHMVDLARSALDYFGDDLPPVRDEAERAEWLNELTEDFEDALWDALYAFKREKQGERRQE